MSKPYILIGDRRVGPEHPPLVIAEAGINHEGSLDKALQLVEAAHAAGCECIKFQTHIVSDEMIPNDVVPGNSTETIYNIIERCALSEDDERKIQRAATALGMQYLSTPFSRAAAERLHGMSVPAYKIGSGECNNYPLVRHIANYGKPVILSTGMNDMTSIATAVGILRNAKAPFALLHCTSVYPTPYHLVRLGAISELAMAFPDAVVGLSDHSTGIHTAIAAVALGASILEKHFTCDSTWPGPDVPLSIGVTQLAELIEGSRAVYSALGGRKEVLSEEQPTIRFAYASVVSTQDIQEGGLLTVQNTWVKRPGTGEVPAVHYEQLLGRKVKHKVPKDRQIKWSDLQ
jgi:sialic acid synthase SpsE